MSERNHYDPNYKQPADYKYGSPGWHEAQARQTYQESARSMEEERARRAGSRDRTDRPGGNRSVGCLGVLGILFAVALLGDLSRGLFVQFISIIENLGAGSVGGLIVVAAVVAGVSYVSGKLGGAILFIIGFAIFSVGCPTPLNLQANGATLTWSVFTLSVALFIGGYYLMKNGRWFIGSTQRR